MQRRSENKKLGILKGLIIVTIIFIWGQSLLPGRVSESESGWVLQAVRPVLDALIGRDNVTMHLIRKLAHFTEYFVLGAELTLYFYTARKVSQNTRYHCTLMCNDTWYSGSLTMACGLAVAVIDEVIQLFVEGRGSSVTDVVIDFSGVTAATIIVLIIIKFKRNSKRSKGTNERVDKSRN